MNKLPPTALIARSPLQTPKPVFPPTNDSQDPDALRDHANASSPPLCPNSSPAPDPTKNLFPDSSVKEEALLNLSPLDELLFDDDDSDSEDFLPLDPLKFLLSHFRVDEMDPDIFRRFKERSFTIPHLAEDMLKADAFFKTQVTKLTDEIISSDGFLLQSSIKTFFESAVVPQTSSLEISVLLTIYFLTNLPANEKNQKRLLCARQAQDFIEMALRVRIDRFSEFIKNLKSGAIRDSSLLLGTDLKDSEGARILGTFSKSRPKYLMLLFKGLITARS